MNKDKMNKNRTNNSKSAKSRFDKLSNEEYIKSLFDDDDIRAPESLSEDKMLSMLEAFEAEIEINADPVSESEQKKSWDNFKTMAKTPKFKFFAAAACMVLAIAALPSIYYSDLFMPDTSVQDGELYTFTSSQEIEHVRGKIDHLSPGRGRNGFSSSGPSFGAGDSVEEAATEYEADYADDTSYGVYSTEKTADMELGAEHSTTYLQVAEIDEADIVKVDSRYIYCVTDKREVAIYEAAKGEVKRLSTIGNNGIENYISNIFLKGDTLVSIGRVYENKESYIAVVSYDITDRSKPTLINQFRQSGDSIISSRMIGDYVYIVTSTYMYHGEFSIPKCTIDGEYREMDACDISCVPNPKEASFTVLSAVDIASGKAGKSKSKAVFGASDTIYCNNQNLYIAVEEWESGESVTRIVRAALDGLNVKFDRTATVSGYIINQFSMDEDDGYFRIATTSDREGMNVNNLFVLDDKLKEVGAIKGFARDESIKAVRFMGKKAYMITYESIDPLFVMDLSEPENPRIEGEVKIDGFSSLLVPIGKDRLLGIGYATGDNGYGGIYDEGLKLALFDVSNPSEPKVLESMEFENMESPAQSTHLALVVNKAAGYYAIPYEVPGYYYYDYDEDDDESEYEDGERIEDESGVLVFGVEGDEKDKIEVYDKHKIDSRIIKRSVYIGDYIYAISDEAGVTGFKFEKQ